ncbi:MAG: phosphotransferase [Caldilineaceae bacterium]
MTTHLERHRAEMERLAWPAVADFVAAHPQYQVDADQSGSTSVTNFVIFGQHTLADGSVEPVVFKYFCQDERKEREIFALRHFAATGLAPQLLAEQGARLIVMTRLPGAFLPNAETAREEFSKLDATQIGYTLGQATATLLRVPLTASTAQEFERRFYDGETLTTYLGDILAASHAIHQRVAYYRGATFGRSLAHIETHLAYILRQPRLLYHQDAMNMHFAGSRFVGFFDLEMCRVGTEAMQLGSLWQIFAGYDAWTGFAEGFANTTGRTLTAHDVEAGRAFAHFMVWRYISDYGEWQGEPLDPAAMAALEQEAPAYQAWIERNEQV